MNKEVYIHDKENLNKKIESFKKDGSEGFHVISDFDGTLTKAYVKGQKTHTTLAQIREGRYLTQDYPQKAYALFDKYHPYEIDPNLSLEEKSKKMVEWWSAHLDLFIECGMNKGVIEEIIQKEKLESRTGFLEFLDILSKNKIPLLIFSASNGNIIEKYLEFKKSMYNNIHIISNFFIFNKSGRVIGYRDNIIHTFNKSEVQIKNFPYYKEVFKRKNLILMGDSLGDLGMSKGIQHKNIIKIGFLNENVEDLIERYSNEFDVLILNDGPMNYVNNLIKNILNLKANHL